MHLTLHDYQNFIEHPLSHVIALEADASKRSYVRLLSDHATYIASYDPDELALGQFMRVAQLLRECGLSAPQIIEKMDAHRLLMEDLGELTFTQCIKGGHITLESLYNMATEVLIHLRDSLTQRPEFIPLYSQECAHKDVCKFLNYRGLKNEPDREGFQIIWRDLFTAAFDVPHRLAMGDFHVDNLLYLPNQVGIKQCGVLDFQDATWAPVTFDLVSLLHDARQDVPDDIEAHQWNLFLNGYPEPEQHAIKQSGMIMSMSRHLRIIELFSRLSREGRRKYGVHLPRLWNYVKIFIAKEPNLFNPLHEWMKTNVAHQQTS